MLSGFQSTTPLHLHFQQLYQAINQLKSQSIQARLHGRSWWFGIRIVVDQHDLGVATGKMIAQVLKGAKPADTPVNVFHW